MQAPPEQLGSFYLGAEYDIKTGQRLENPINYDARDLTTHAICVGMTGSGKTGLCIGLLEEAALDRVPTILIDPKGDITNLLLQFPQLQPEDFKPWVNPDDARRKGQSIDEYAVSVAGLWRSGLADWGQGPERLQMLKDSADFTIYTPGSDAGVPISIMGSLAAPGLDFDANAEAIRERISGTVAALLGLVGLKADPMRSREAILLSNIFEFYWRQNKNLDLTTLILSIQNPPVRQLGVFEVDTFFPEKDRFSLAMEFNNLLAAPTFQSWLKGENLDVDSLFYTRDGVPRHSIFYIAHLSDSERMFFVTLLLENMVTWVRRQAGTTSLRAALYFDEIFGFLPPIAEPPSKRPLLTLLKQARAVGLGVVLVSQNPVDLDYKALTNAGTWFIGKLQAERDKDRVLQGLKGAITAAGGSGDQVDYNTLLGQLSNRVFLMHNVHSDRPLVFHTRWAMSYLRGPLTKMQVSALMESRKQAAPTLAAVLPPTPVEPGTLSAALSPASAEKPVEPEGFSAIAPMLGKDIPQVFLPVDVHEREAMRPLSRQSGQAVDVERIQLVYEPGLLGAAEVRFVDPKRKINEQVERVLLLPGPIDVRRFDWGDAVTLPLGLHDLLDGPEVAAENQGTFFAPVPKDVNNNREIAGLSKKLADWLYYNSKQTLNVHPELGLFQHPNETPRAFKIRLQQAAREARDDEVDKLEQKYEKQMERLEAKLRKEKRELANDEANYGARKQQEMVSIGESVVGFFIGRRSTRAMSTVMSKRRLASQALQNIQKSKAMVEELQQDIEKLEAELQEQVRGITARWAGLLDNVIADEITPRRTDVHVTLVALAWLPAWLVTYHDGRHSRTEAVPAYALPDEAQ